MGHPSDGGDDPSARAEVIRSPVDGGVGVGGGGGGSRKRGHPNDLRTLFSSMRVSSFSQSVGGGAGGIEFASTAGAGASHRPSLTRAASLAAAGAGGASRRPALTRAASLASVAPSTDARRWREARVEEEGGSSPSPSPPGPGGSTSASNTPHRPDEEDDDPEVSASRLADVLRASLRLGEDDGVDDDMFMEMADAMIRCKIRNAANNNGEEDDDGDNANDASEASAADGLGARAGERAGAASRAGRGRRIDPTAEAAAGRTGRPGPGVASAFSSARRLDVDFDDDDEGDAIGSSSAGSSSDEWVRVEEEISGSGEAASMVREDLAEATRRGVERIRIDDGGDRRGARGGIDHRGDASAEAAAATVGGGKDDDLDGGEGADHPTTPAAAAGATTAATPSIRLRSAEIGRSCPSFWSAGTGGFPSPPEEADDDEEYLTRPLDDDDDGAGVDVDVDVHVHEGERVVGRGDGPSSSSSGGGTSTTNGSGGGVGVDRGVAFNSDVEKMGTTGAAAPSDAAATTTPHVRAVRFADARCGGDGDGDGDGAGLRSGGAAATTAAAAATDPEATWTTAAAPSTTTPVAAAAAAAAAETVPQFLRVDPSEIKFDVGIDYTPKNVSSNATMGVRVGATPHTVTKGGKMRRKASPRVAVRPRATTPSTAFKFAFAPPPQPQPQPPTNHTQQPPPPQAGDVGGGVAPSHASTNGNFGGTSTGPGMSQPSAAPFAAAAAAGVGGGYATNEPASVPAPAQVPTSNGAGATAATAPMFPSATGPPPTTATAAPSVPGFAVDLKSSRSTGHGHGRRRGSAMRLQQRKSSLVRNTSSSSGGAVGSGTGSGGLPGGAVAADTAAAAAAAARPSVPGFPVDATIGVHASSSSFARATSCGSAGGHGAQTSSAAAPTGGPPGVHFPQQPHPSQHPQHPPQSHLPQQPHPQPPPPQQQQQQQTQQQSNHEAVDGNLFSPMSIGSCGGGGDATASGGTPTFTVGLSPPSRSNQRKKATGGGGRRGRSASFRHQRTAHPHSQQRRSATAATMRGEAAAATANADVDRPRAHPEVPDAAAVRSVPKEIFTHGVPAMNTAAATGRGHDATTGPGVVEGSAVGAGAAAGVAATEPAAPAADYTGRNARAASLREEARDHYTSGDYRSSVNAYTQAIAVVAGGPGHSSRPPDDKEMLAVLHGNRGAALMMLGAYRAAAEDCGVALSMVDATLRAGRRLSPDGGPTQASKLYGRMGRAHLKSGMIDDASRAFSTAVDIAERARKCLRDGLVEDDDRGRAEQVLGHTVNDATLGLAEIVRCKEAMRCSSLPYIQPVQVLHHVDKVLAVCPGSTEFHNRKITTLAALKRWFDVALACERLACDALRFEGVFVGDLRSMDPFARLSPATNLNADHFRDELSSSRKPLGAKEAAEAVLRLPSSLQPVYLRALRLEERYTEASKASTSLEVFAGTTSPRYGTQEQFAWIHGEREKLKRTTSTKERGDRNFRKGEYARAVDNYTVCLSVDSETAATQEDNAGGRLHAVLFCNRAACFMALRKYGAAAKDCTAALRIQPFYMKATLRRGRCYARMESFEASIADYKKWIDFVAKPDATLRAFDLTSAVPPAEVERVKQELADVKRSMRDFIEKQRAEAQAREREEHRRWYKENFPRHRWNTSGTGSPHQRKHGGHHNNGSRAEGRRDSRDRSGSRNDGQDQHRTNQHTDESANHYNVLQVRRNCSTADIKKAYRKMALKYHPDKNKDPDAADIFRRVNAAYNVLSDNNSRRQYDISLRLGCH